jgi:hypothetical protein
LQPGARFPSCRRSGDKNDDSPQGSGEVLSDDLSGVFGQHQRRIQNHLGWLDGYYKDEQDPPVINSDALAASLNKLNEYCAAKPAFRLITAADELFHK